MLDKIKALLEEVETLQASNAEELEALRIKYLSKKGALTALMADFRDGPFEQKKEGGIRINENCECCDKDFEPIPGLYAVGADACNIYDDSYMFLLPGNSMGYAVNTGRIAGMEAAAYVQEQ